MALFDSLGDNASGLYGNIFTDPQKAALGQRGLLGFLGGMANSGALDYTMPTITGKLPGGFAKGLAGGMAGMGEAQDAAAMNALKAQLVGLQGQDLASKIEMNKWMMNDTDSTTKLLQQLGLAGGAPATGGAAGAPQTAGADTGISDPRGLAPYIADTAKKYGIDPTIALKVAASEGLGNPVGDGGKSGGAFQLYTGDPKAVGSRFKKDTGLDPLDPANEKATIDYAMKTAAQEGWGAWNGAKKLGITGFNGIGQPRPVQLASAGGDLPQTAIDAATPQATPGAADMSAIPQAVPGTNISVPGMPQNAAAPPAGVQMAQASPPVAQAPMAAPQGAPGAPGVAMSPDAAAKQALNQRLLTSLALKNARINTVTGRDPYKDLIGVLQNSPEAKAAIATAEARGKLPFTPVVGRPGTEGGFYDENRVYHQGNYTPNLPVGANLQRDANGNPVAVPVPGAQALIRQDAQAKAGGEAAYQPQPVLMPGGGLGVLPRSQVLEAGRAVPTALSPQEKSAQEALGGQAVKYGDMLQPPGIAPPSAPAAQPANLPTGYQQLDDKSIWTPRGTVIPPIDKQTLPRSEAELKPYAEKTWPEMVDSWASAAPLAEAAEQRTTAMIDAMKDLETKPFNTAKADISARMRSLGLDVLADQVMSGKDTSTVQFMIHNNIANSLQTLKGVTNRFTQQEFKVTTQNSVNPDITPAANKEMAINDLAMVRNVKTLPQDWNDAQRLSNWRNPVSFAAARMEADPLHKQVESIRQEVGDTKGMAKPADAATINSAKDAIARGAPRDAVIKRLQEKGFSADGL